MNRFQAVEQMKAVFTILSSDVKKIREYENFHVDEAAQRSLIRAHFAFIEGMVYLLRSVALASAAETNIFSPKEVAVLREENYSLNKKGQIESIESFEKILPMMLFSMQAYARIHGIAFEPKTGAHGWEAMKKYVTIRNALAHPKTVADLLVNEEKTKTSSDANDWFHDNVVALLNACEDADAAFESDEDESYGSSD